MSVSGKEVHKLDGSSTHSEIVDTSLLIQFQFECAKIDGVRLPKTIGT